MIEYHQPYSRRCLPGLSGMQLFRRSLGAGRSPGGALAVYRVGSFLRRAPSPRGPLGHEPEDLVNMSARSDTT
jgi:hypothetical protein